MSDMPELLRGATAIGARLGISPAQAGHMHREGRLPTFRVGGTPYATAGALDEWCTLVKAGQIPRD